MKDLINDINELLDQLDASLPPPIAEEDIDPTLTPDQIQKADAELRAARQHLVAATDGIGTAVGLLGILDVGEDDEDEDEDEDYEDFDED